MCRRVDPQPTEVTKWAIDLSRHLIPECLPNKPWRVEPCRFNEHTQSHCVYEALWLIYDWTKQGKSCWAKYMELSCQFITYILCSFESCFLLHVSVLNSVRFAPLKSKFTLCHAALAISSSQIILVRCFAALQSSFAPSLYHWWGGEGGLQSLQAWHCLQTREEMNTVALFIA